LACRNAEGWRAFGGVENAKASAGAGADVNQAAAGFHASSDGFDGFGDGGEFAADGAGDFGVLAVHQANDFERAPAIEIFRRGVSLFADAPGFTFDGRPLCVHV
jgi:hypothetical protein